ncbi:hypothetical protein Trco_002008 [Trichoderma cornu-damae]|uniref:Uncharacterized protein n=1 Tax=Trichoderma cornu-damae TaxID=654480 RepID=A0A9P8TY18_9HYPO|nr:hypothetical protein Trco_002008 [Trichoderma cornu-damae]
MDGTREGIASVISTIRAQIAEQPLRATGSASQPPSPTAFDMMTGSTPPALAFGAPAGSSPEETSASLPLARGVSASTNTSSGLAANVTERSGSVPHPHHSQQQPDVSPRPSEVATGQIGRSDGVATAPKAADQSGQGSQNGTSFSSSAPPPQAAVQGPGKSKAYTALMELVRKTDPSVVRQVVRENWNKCLVGSDYHAAFIANVTITCCSPTILGHTINEIGDRLIKAAKREIANQFEGQDLDEVADLIGPKLSLHFQDRVMATRLETIGAQDLINALARAERLGYHVDDIVKKKPGLGSESVIPSMSTVPPSRPPMPPHLSHAGAPPQQTPPYRVMQSHNPVPVLASTVVSHQKPSAPPQAPLVVPPGVQYCQRCHRPCSSPDALNYHLKKAKCGPPRPDDDYNTDVCVHCGCRFESTGGLAYHTKSDVCGKHDEKKKMQMVELLKSRASNQPLGTQRAPIHHATPGRLTSVASTPMPNTTPKAAVYMPTPGSSGSDPYAKLTPDERVRFNEEMKSIENYYVTMMRNAAINLPPGPREEEIAKLKNRYNTKQSNTRKKYGIRLRERRTNADLDRSWNTTPADHPQVAKRARVDDGTAQSTQAVPQIIEVPRWRVPLSKMGGLSASSGTAELVDPTASSIAPRPPPPAGYQPAAPAAAVQGAPYGAHQGTPNDPMQIDDDSSTDTDSDNVDIPARIKTT